MKRNFKDLNHCLICKKDFKNLNGLAIHCKSFHNIKIHEYIVENILKKQPLCKCGCGKKVSWYQNKFHEYLTGHFSKTKLFNNPWSKKGRTPNNKINFSKNDYERMKDMFIKEHKSIKTIAKYFNCSINPIKCYLRNNLKNYFELVSINNSWRKKNIPELNQKMKNAAAKGGMAYSKYNNTDIEIKTKEFLNELNVKYIFQYFLQNKQNKYCFDFYIPDKKLLIEVDGDYWHGNPKIYKTLNKDQIYNKKRDERKNKFVKELGLNLLRFWGSDIHKLTTKEFSYYLNKNNF